LAPALASAPISMVSPCAAAASFAKVDAENGQFTYDHSVKTFVVGADRHFFATLDLSSEAALV
jgi:hypothetical protein